MKALLLVVAALACLAFADAAAAHSRTLVVDRDKVQCPRADYTSIQAAVNAARAGDTVVVCPDLYTEDVTVSKPLTITGTGGGDDEDSAAVPIDCFTPSLADPATQAIVEGAVFAFDLQASNITVRRLVIQNSATGVLTHDAFSGYRLSQNVFQANDGAGVNFLSSGARLSRIDHNCLRFNGAGGVTSEGGDLRRARLDHNHTFRVGGFDISGAGARQDVTVDGNVSREDFSLILLSNSTESRIVGNDVGASFNGISVAGGNVGLEVALNRVHDGTGSGILIATILSFPVFPASTGTRVVGNEVSGFTFEGIQAFIGSASSSFIVGNDTHDNGRDGIRLRAGNTGNTVAVNRSDRNGRNGIYAQGATGNRFLANTMHGNVVFDARDDARTTNTWTHNACATDSPPGTICGVG